MKFFKEHKTLSWSILGVVVLIAVIVYVNVSTYQDKRNIFDCFFNFELSKDRLLTYLNMACSNEWSPEEIYAESKFLFLSNLLFGRILVDNSKSFAKQLELKKLRSIINDYGKKDEFKMMKLLRDFGQHFSLPITNLIEML